MQNQVSCPCKTSNNLWTFNWAGPHYIVVNVDASSLHLAHLIVGYHLEGKLFKDHTRITGKDIVV